LSKINPSTITEKGTQVTFPYLTLILRTYFNRRRRYL